GIGKQIQEQLAQLLSIRLYGRQFGSELANCFDLVITEVVTKKIQRGCYFFTQVYCGYLPVAASAKLQQVIYQGRHAIHFFKDHFKRATFSFVLPQLSYHRLCTKGNRCQRIVQLVCNAGCQFTHCRQFRRLPELLRGCRQLRVPLLNVSQGPLKLGDVLLDCNEVRDIPSVVQDG